MVNKFLLTAAVVGILTLGAKPGFAQTDSVLYTFLGGADGGVPSGLIMDEAGNLYGTTSEYGDGPCTFPFAGCGTVFELSPTDSGWNFQVVYTFQGGEDGDSPSSSLTLDPEGNLYGTTSYGGGLGCGYYGCGTVFELKRTADGWVNNILYKFSGGADGSDPAASLVLDGNGNIYGTTAHGGDNSCYYSGPGCGVVFKLSRSNNIADQNWSETVLHTFQGPDGADPAGGVTLASSKFCQTDPHIPICIFGTTSNGGLGDPISEGGVVFELIPNESSWDYRMLYEFPAGLGGPAGKLILDHAGNLYGMGWHSGLYGSGSVFEVRPIASTSEGWDESDIYSFSGPNGLTASDQGLTPDARGNLYGSTARGGTSPNCIGGCGTVFRLSKSGATWYESALFSLTGGSEGWEALSGVVLDRKGDVYSVASYGGDVSCGYYGCGVIFRVGP